MLDIFQKNQSFFNNLFQLSSFYRGWYYETMISSSFLYGSLAFSSQNLCPPAINLDSFAIKSATFFSSITQFGAHILGIGRRSHQHKSHLQYFMACRQFFSTRVGANPARSQNPLQAK